MIYLPSLLRELASLLESLGLLKIMFVWFGVLMMFSVLRRLIKLFSPFEYDDGSAAGDDDGFEEDEENVDPWEQAMRAAELRQRQHYAKQRRRS